MREKTYSTELADREQSWSQAQGALETSWPRSNPSPSRGTPISQSRITDLEKGQTQEQAHIESLQENSRLWS